VAAAAAIATLAPVELGFATVPLPTGLAVNRRGLPFDPKLTLLDLWAGGRRLATVTNVGIHPVTHGPDVHVVTADWVGHFRAAFEASSGGTALLLAGPLGDVNPPAPPGVEGYERLGGGPVLAKAVGERVADVALAATASVQPAGGVLSATYETIELPAVAGTVSRLISGGAGRVLAELYDWQVGDVQLVSLPGEPLSAFGDAVTDRRPGATVLAGLAPSWQGYLPHPELFDDTGYEESMGLGREAMTQLLAAVLA
jgi:hypothetical protein